MHFLDKHNTILQNAHTVHTHQEDNVVASDFLELPSRRRGVYVSGFFNDVVSTAKTNFLVYFDRVETGTQTDISSLRFCSHDDTKGCTWFTLQTK